MEEKYKVGDVVWFISTEYGRDIIEYETIVEHSYVEINVGTIVFINEHTDSIHVYVNGERNIYGFGFHTFEDKVKKSKNEVIDSMIKSLEKLK